MSITLYNSKTRAKEAFVPIDRKNLRMYVCGPTVYDRAHLGNARPAIVFDVLYRLLRHTYGADHVTYVRNFTDVDDKINAKAAATGRSITDICDETISWYLADMAAVGVMEPTHMPRATQYIGQMVAMIAGLIASGHAYAAQGHVMFRVRSYKNYGALSGRSVDDMIAGARIEISPFKEDPMDFVLWKPSNAGEPGWDSPWGFGRPGWHIECSAMAAELLGDTFDIHGGGLDLQFPHHENELAQSACAHPHGEFAKVWMHNEMLQVEGKKMSKSLGNFFTVRDLLDQGYAGEVIRFVMLSTHYRKPMDWTEAKAREAETVLRKVAAFLAADPLSKPWVATQYAVPPQEVVDALSNDLNTSSALTFLAKYLREMNEMALVGTLQLLGFYPHAIKRNFASFEFSANGIPRKVGYQMDSRSILDDATHQRVEALGNKLHELRISAKQTKDFSAVDAFRSALADAGIEVQMSKDGVQLTPTPTFNPSKLDALQ